MARLAWFPPRTRNQPSPLGVSDQTIQGILRHPNIATTMNIYVKAVSEDSTAVMKLLETTLSSNSAPAPTPDGQRMINWVLKFVGLTFRSGRVAQVVEQCPFKTRRTNFQ
jgi:hypothetical protein